jgi:glycosyltransferase 2 family protein
VTTAADAARSARRRAAWWRWARVAIAAATLGVLVWRLGTGPFLHGLRTVDGRTLAAGVALGVLTTVCCAWRWRIVARGLGVDLPLGTAVAAYYRSLFLNVTLPGGVVGDVHRGISHGRDTSDVGRGLRAVAWERSAGQAVQVVLAVAVLLVAPSPVQGAMPLVALALLAAALGVALAARGRTAARRSRWARLRGAVARDLRAGLLARGAWAPIALASALVVAGQVAMFLIAARTAGVTAPASRMLPLALLVMLAAALPNVGGWGPREGVTAWAFAGAGLGASLGVATAVVYGVMVFVSSLPGAAVLVAGGARRTRPAPWLGRQSGPPVPSVPPAPLGVLAPRDGAPDV